MLKKMNIRQILLFIPFKVDIQKVSAY